MGFKLKLPRKFSFKLPSSKLIIPVLVILIILSFLSSGYLFFLNSKLNGEIVLSQSETGKRVEELNQVRKQYEELKNQDQVKRNNDLEKEIGQIVASYRKASEIYEEIVELRLSKADTKGIDAQFSKVLGNLSKRDYTGAESELNQLSAKIKEEENKVAAAFKIPENVPVVNSAPGSGYSRQQVQTESGTFMVSIVAADLTSTRIIVDTASATDCANDCPTLPLSNMVARNNAYAGIHGAYYCPADYPSCAGKVNSFDLLIMNKDKYYFNSANNVYSVNPAVVFGGSYIRFVPHASDWGRDTGIDSMLSNFPLLVYNNEIYFRGDSTPKFNIKSTRGFVANKGNSVYIGIVHNATVAESALTLKAMGMENALNLDGGGTTALWHGGYKAGPGRNLTNAILFVRK